MRYLNRSVPIAATVALTLGAPALSLAQAWVPPRGEGSVSLVYQQVYVRDHVYSDGSREDLGHIRSHSTQLEIDYGVTDRLSITAGLPYVTSRYDGRRAHKFADGSSFDPYNSGVQDLHFDARYSLAEVPVAFTPFIGVNLPTHDYPVFAHSAIGLGLKEVQVGTYAGMVRAPVYFHVRYSYGRLERVLGRGRARSNIDAEMGWFISPRWRVFGFEAGQVSHGGLECVRGACPQTWTQDEFHHHDQLQRTNLLDVGGGVALAITGTVELAGGIRSTVSARNAHADRYAATFGVSWNFRARPSRPHAGGTTRPSAGPRAASRG